MIRRAFLHIGTPKSGTSYLQDRFAANRDLLRRNGLDYVDTATGDHFHAAIDLLDKRWAGEIERARGSWNALVAAARSVTGDVLISHEVLASATPDQVARAFADLADFEIHVIVTARDLARQIPAEWQEKIKHRGWVGFADWLNRVTNGQRMPADTWFWKVQHLPDVLSRWSAGLPPEHVHLIALPLPGAAHDELWNRFLGVVGLPVSSDYAEAEVDNASLGIAQIRVLRRLNNLVTQAGVSRPTYLALVREILVKEVFAQQPDRVAATVPPTMQPFLDEVNVEWRDWIIGSGIDLTGSIDELMSTVPPGPWTDPDEPDPAAVFEAATSALAALVIDADREDAPEPGLPGIRPGVKGVLRRWVRG